MSSTKKTWIVIGVIVVLIVIVWLWYVASTPIVATEPLPSQSSVSLNVGTSSPATVATTTVKFSSEPYYSFAYQIYPKTSTQSSAQKQALSGFLLSSKKNTDGSVTVTLTPTNSKFSIQHYTVLPGETLYFIERSLRDDTNNQDYFPMDDTAVIVDHAGNVVQ